MVEQEGAVQPALDVISDRYDPNEMPLAKRPLLDVALANCRGPRS